MLNININKNVVVLFGINGVGKSTIIRKLESDLDHIKVLHGSQILSELFNGLSRKELEKQSDLEKKEFLVDQLIKLFNLYNNYQYILLDTHLLVPIRKNGVVNYENMWSKSFIPYLRAICYIYAKPEDILSRRRIDSVRKRNLKLLDIYKDQSENMSFLNVLKNICPIKVFENVQNNTTNTCSNILFFLKKL